MVHFTFTLETGSSGFFLLVDRVQFLARTRDIAYYLRHSRLSVHPSAHLSVRPQSAHFSVTATGRIPKQFYIGDFYENLWRNHTFGTNQAKYRAIYTKTRVCLIFSGNK